MKFGGTPLHWSSSREVIDSLISNNCDMNALNFDNRTALHIMVILLYKHQCYSLFLLMPFIIVLN